MAVLGQYVSLVEFCQCIVVTWCRGILWYRFYVKVCKCFIISVLCVFEYLLARGVLIHVASGVVSAW